MLKEKYVVFLIGAVFGYLFLGTLLGFATGIVSGGKKE